jgi:Ca2+-binding EF-hand superfamily protein
MYVRMHCSVPFRTVPHRSLQEADTDGSGDVSRDELLALLEQNPGGLMTFLKSCGTTQANNGGLSIFDAIEANDDETISWAEFLR